MVRKGIFLLIILAIGITVFPYKGQGYSGDDYKVIPDEAIRLRILANSNADDDQDLKRKIRDEVNAQITEWVAELDNLEEARQVIRDHIPEVEVAVKEVMEQEGKVQDFNVKFDRVDFPTKLYGPYLYPAGEYEALLITLGEGNGANWWCVLFPPLCFLDFANGTSINPVEAYPERELSTKVKVKFLALEWFSKFFG